MKRERNSGCLSQRLQRSQDQISVRLYPAGGIGQHRGFTYPAALCAVTGEIRGGVKTKKESCRQSPLIECDMDIIAVNHFKETKIISLLDRKYLLVDAAQKVVLGGH